MPRYLLEDGTGGGYRLEDDSGVLLIESPCAGLYAAQIRTIAKHHYRLDERSGTTAVDELGVLNGTYTGAVQLGRPGALADDPGTSVGFGPSGVRVALANDASLDYGDVFSLEAWIAHNSATAWQVSEKIISRGTGGYCLSVRSSGSTGVVFLDDPNTQLIAHSSVAISDTAWHHLVVTKNGSTSKVYLDGVDVTVLNTNAVITNNGNPIGIGSESGGGEEFAGRIDEVALYNVALTAEQVLVNYQLGTCAFVSKPSAAYGRGAEPLPWQDWSTADDTAQSYAIQPPAVQTFDPAAGFPWNTDDGERFVTLFQARDFTAEDASPGLVPPTDPSILGGIYNDDGSEVPYWSAGVDDTSQPYPIGPPAGVQNDDGEGARQALPTFDDTYQAWTPQPGFDPVLSAPWNEDGADVLQARPGYDDTAQPFAIQPPAAAPFDPSAGFPWNADDSERFVTLPTADDNVGFALGLVPPTEPALLAGAWNSDGEPILQARPVVDDTAQAWPVQVIAPVLDPSLYAGTWNSDGEGARQSVPVVDDTTQSWPIQIIADSAIYAGVWNLGDVVLPLAPVYDDTAQSWPVGPPVPVIVNDPAAEYTFWYSSAPEIQSWPAQTVGGVTVVTGGAAPGGRAFSELSGGMAASPVPAGKATANTPGGAAVGPVPIGNATTETE